MKSVITGALTIGVRKH